MVTQSQRTLPWALPALLLTVLGGLFAFQPRFRAAESMRASQTAAALAHTLAVLVWMVALRGREPKPLRAGRHRA